jgi:hypothetical protein
MLVLFLSFFFSFLSLLLCIAIYRLQVTTFLTLARVAIDMYRVVSCKFSSGLLD